VSNIFVCVLHCLLFHSSMVLLF